MRRLTTSPIDLRHRGIADNLRMTDPTQSPITLFADDTDPPPPIARPSMRFMLSHPAHWMALGFGSGLSRIAPGTAGTA